MYGYLEAGLVEYKVDNFIIRSVGVKLVTICNYLTIVI